MKSRKASKVGGPSAPRSLVAKRSARESGRKGPSHWKRSRRPLVAATFAMTVDGKITTRAFSPVDFTSREDKRHLLRQRSLGDAVLIGRSTLAHDNVRLGLPDPLMRAEREARGQTPYPLRVIVSNEGRIDPALKIFQTDFSKILIFSTTRMPRRLPARAARESDLASDRRIGRSICHECYRNCAANIAFVGWPAKVARSYSAVCSSLSWSISLTSRSRPTFSEVGGAPTLTGRSFEFLKHGSIRCVLREMRVVEEECFLKFSLRYAKKTGSRDGTTGK